MLWRRARAEGVWLGVPGLALALTVYVPFQSVSAFSQRFVFAALPHGHRLADRPGPGVALVEGADGTGGGDRRQCPARPSPAFLASRLVRAIRATPGSPAARRGNVDRRP